MDNLNTDQEVCVDATNEPEWMLPSAALGRFEMPADKVIVSAVEREILRYGFRIGTYGMLIKPESGSEVLQMATIATLPGAPYWLQGLINLRGNLIPIFDLKHLLCMEHSSTQEKLLVLVFDQGEKAVGVLIDGFPKPISELKKLPAIPPQPAVLKQHVSAAYVKEDQIWLDFDHATFFDELVRLGEE